MYQPATYAVTLAFMITSMLCWGSWANTVKLCPGYRFQLFYWDYVIGLVVGIVVSLLQAVTQIQEQTLTFIPKIVSMVAAAIVLMPWMSHRLALYATALFSGTHIR